MLKSEASCVAERHRFLERDFHFHKNAMMAFLRANPVAKRSGLRAGARNIKKVMRTTSQFLKILNFRKFFYAENVTNKNDVK